MRVVDISAGWRLSTCQARCQTFRLLKKSPRCHPIYARLRDGLCRKPHIRGFAHHALSSKQVDVGEVVKDKLGAGLAEQNSSCVQDVSSAESVVTSEVTSVTTGAADTLGESKFMRDSAVVGFLRKFYALVFPTAAERQGSVRDFLNS